MTKPVRGASHLCGAPSRTNHPCQQKVGDHLGLLARCPAHKNVPEGAEFDHPKAVRKGPEPEPVVVLPDRFEPRYILALNNSELALVRRGLELHPDQLKAAKLARRIANVGRPPKRDTA